MLKTENNISCSDGMFGSFTKKLIFGLGFFLKVPFKRLALFILIILKKKVYCLSYNLPSSVHFD